MNRLSMSLSTPVPPMPDSALFQPVHLAQPIHYAGENATYRDILGRLSEGSATACQQVFSLSKSLERQSISLEDFRVFLQTVHDLLVLFDSTKRASLFRTIRYSVTTLAHVQTLVEEEIHYAVIMSLEKESDYSMERIQALKIVDRSRRVCGSSDFFPISFVRSLVSIANSREDNFRKIAIESLRELSLANPALVATVQGFSTLMDAVVDPVSQDIADSILHSVLFLLNDPSTRKVVSPCIDLKSLLVSFTDLDSDPAEMEVRWQAAKSAFNIMMRSWVGVNALASSDSALPMLIRMLKDVKISPQTHLVILDAIIEVLSPLFSKVKYTTRSRRRFASADPAKDNAPMSPTNARQSPTVNSSAHRQNRANSDSEMLVANNTPGATGAAHASAGITSSSSSSALPQQHTREPQQGNRSSFSFLSHQRSDDALHRRPSTSSQGSAASTAMSSTMSASSLSSSAAPQSRHFSMNLSSIFSSRASRAKAAAAMPPKDREKDREREFASALTLDQRDALRRASIANRNGNVNKLHVQEETEDFSDPIYNLMDNYTGLLCCAFLHVDLLSSLFVLGVEGSPAVAMKSRQLLVQFVQILARILPENVCAELLTNPTLIEVASTLDVSGRASSRAHRASQLLVDIAKAFSVLPQQRQRQRAQTTVAHPHAALSPSLSARARAGSITNRPTLASSNKEALTMSSNTGGITANSNMVMRERSNFFSLNIETLFELAEEMKISSFAARDILSLSSSSAATLDALQTLRNTLTPAVDKQEFLRQMEASRVIGKEGKEPFKWDWVVLSDMLEHSFRSTERLTEALRTKWVRRLSGFFRCSTDEKGFFANLEWEPTNLQYLECAARLYAVLLRDDNGVSFLLSDRRGMLFNEIARELEQLTMCASSAAYALASTAAGSTTGSSSAANTGTLNSTGTNGNAKNVFRLSACHTQMAREYFVLLGRVARTPGSRRLLDHTNIFKYLSQLGAYPSLDYLCRLVLSSLAFSDNGVMSKHLLQLWTTQPSCSVENKTFFHSLLRVMLHSFATCHSLCARDSATSPSSYPPSQAYLSSSSSFYGGYACCCEDSGGGGLARNANFQWCLETIVSQLSVDDSPSPVLLKALNEAIHNRFALRLVISKRPKIINEPLAQDLLVRFLAVPEGIDYLVEKNWLDHAFNEWQTSRCDEYVNEVEERISVALLASMPRRKTDTHPRRVLFTPTPQTPAQSLSPASAEAAEARSAQNMLLHILQAIDPIVIKTPESVRELSAPLPPPPATPSSSEKLSPFSAPANTNASANTSTTGGSSSASQRQDPNAHFVVDLHGFLRMPWNIETKLISQPAGALSPENLSGDYLRMDSFLDTTDMPSPLSYEISSDTNRIMKVRGLVLDHQGLPNGRAVSPTTTIATTLTAGACPVLRSGRVMPLSEMRALGSMARRRTSTNPQPFSTANASRASLALSALGEEPPSADQDEPVSLGLENAFDWFFCKSSQRQGQLAQGEQGRLYLALPGDPVVFIFERKQVTSIQPLRPGRAGSVSSRAGEWDGARQNTYQFGGGSASTRTTSLFLVEVQFFFRIETENSMVVPMPRNFFGELSRTLEGCAHLARRSFVMDLVTKLRTSYDALIASVSTPPATHTATLSQVAPSASISIGANTTEIRSALWTLAHIAASEFGFSAISNADPLFVEWCINGACASPFFNLRATFFYALGLISRSSSGGRKLNKCGWDFAAQGSTSAVAVPRHYAILFSQLATEGVTRSSEGKRERSSSVANSQLPYASSYFVKPPTCALNLRPYDTDKLSPEQEVLNLICKMPGVILYKECKAKLEAIKKQYPQIFAKRSLFLEVMRLLDSYTFKLTARRDLINLFSDSAKKKDVPSAPLQASTSPPKTSSL